MSGLSAPKGIMTFGFNGPKRLSFIDKPVGRRRSSLTNYFRDSEPIKDGSKSVAR